MIRFFKNLFSKTVPPVVEQAPYKVEVITPAAAQVVEAMVESIKLVPVKKPRATKPKAPTAKKPRAPKKPK